MQKTKFLLLIVLIISITIIQKVKGTNLELIGKVIYIDPGHGGMDPGCVYKDIYEKNINLSISLKLKEKLEQSGAIVYLTRDSNVDLSINTFNHKKSDLNNRIKAINKSKADVFVSIHLNSYSSSTWYGVQLFYNDKNRLNERFAKIMQENIKELNGDRKYKKNNDLYLLKNIQIPGILVEVGFLSNANERYMLQTDKYQNKVANALHNGIVEYLNK